jgi:hypothetical protein
MWLVMGLAVGSLVTAALIWSQRGTGGQAYPPGYFARVAQSVLATAVLAGLARVALDYLSTGGLSTTGLWFGAGWLVGGVVAAWFLSRSRRP